MTTLDIRKLFIHDIPAGLAADPKLQKEMTGKFQWNITGDGGGKWYVDLSEAPGTVTEGEPGTADTTMVISAADFIRLRENPDQNGMPLFFSGKLKILGNQMLAMKLKPFLLIPAL